MKRIWILCGAVALAGILSGCETMQPASYANYGDNTYVLKKFEGAKVRVASINDLSHFDSGCRMVGPIKTAGNRQIADFIKDSLNDELKFAGLFSDDQSAVRLDATLKEAVFSSMTSFTRGFWLFSLQVSNPDNGKSVTANTKYDYDSGFDAATACMNTSAALTPAVQRLINKVFSDPSFAGLIGR
jgi:hypothetical protein